MFEVCTCCPSRKKNCETVLVQLHFEHAAGPVTKKKRAKKLCRHRLLKLVAMLST